jgi:hypothetical protein
MKSRLSILTQNKFRWVLVAFLLPVFGVVAAFAPTSTGDSRHLELKTSKVKTIVQEVTLPLQVSSVAHNEDFWQVDQVRRDDTLGSLFKRMTIRDADAIKFLMLSPDARAINTQLMPGHTLEIKTNLEGKLLHLEYRLDAENILVAGLTPGGYQVATQKLVLQNHHILKSATTIPIDAKYKKEFDAMSLEYMEKIEMLNRS